MYCKCSFYYQRDSNSAMKLNLPHELSREELGYSCLNFIFFPLPNAMECGMSLGCSEQQHLHGEATRTRMTSASRGSSSCSHPDRPTFGRYWVWKCSSQRGCFAFPCHYRISSCDQPGTALAGFVYGSAISHSTELRLRGASCTLYQEKSTHYLGHGWKSQVLDDKLERHFFTQRHLAIACASQKRLVNMARGCLAARPLRNCLKCYIFTPFKTNTNFRTIITLLWFQQHLSLCLSIRLLKRQCCTNQYSDVLLCSCSYTSMHFLSQHLTWCFYSLS